MTKKRKFTDSTGDSAPIVPGETSFLVEENKFMQREQREKEQQGHRKHARVHARDHSDHNQTPGDPLENNPLQHPYFDSQKFDGIDSPLNPEPPLNSEARREFDNERREQEMEKQLRLGNMPKFGTAPKPQGP